MKVIDKTGTERNSNGSMKNPKIKGVVAITESTVTLDWISPSVNYLHVINNDGLVIVGEESLLKNFVFYDNSVGFYRFKRDVDSNYITNAAKVMGTQQYPYSIAREYEAVNHLDLFKKSAMVINPTLDILGDALKYTYGLEFETSMGVIPEEKCFRDGLIPLRDGSISGNEYSSIVLSGNTGLSLLKQEVETLKKYTIFNQDCALHIHMGGFPVERKALFILYQIVWCLEHNRYDGLIPVDSFNTAKYKGTGKDYCKRLPENNDFNSIFNYFTTLNFFGSLEQPHPADPQRDRKWQINGRYYALNLINMFCYKGPKTVEFRFLRPSFNYRKIRFWIAVFNAILLYAEDLRVAYAKNTENTIFEKIMNSRISVSSIFHSSLFEMLNVALIQFSLSKILTLSSVCT
jgi:hypothetical protein